MTQQMPEVDTSLAGQDSGMATGLVGVDSPVSPDLSGDMLPIATPEEFYAALNSSSTPAVFSQFTTQDNPSTRAQVIKFAESFIGTPYVWGGTSPKGFDCSGFTQYVAKRFGVSLPRISQQQANAGERSDIEHLQPGDLVLFPDDTNNGQSGPGHVAIYAGNGTIIEAPHTGATVRVRSIGPHEHVYGVHLTYPGNK